jgi:phage FluMu gp28-like protein
VLDEEQFEQLDAFLPYQQRLMASVSQHAVTVAEKSRRTGYSWAAAAVAVLTAASGAAAGGMDVMYMGYDQEMAREFIGYCADWAKTMEPAAGEVRESFFVDPARPDERILTFRIGFASGFEIMALPSVPRAFRGKQGLAIIDEAAFHAHLDEVLKAALALLMWGGRVLIISTHDGDANQFNVLVQDIRAGRRPYHLLRTTFDEALEEGLYRRICLRTGKVWSAEAEAAWRQEIIAQYGTAADEELFCIPSNGSGSYLSAAVIEARMRDDIPVLRYEPRDGFLMWPEHLRQAEIRDWCEANLAPVLAALDPKAPHCFGQDFGRKRDLSVFCPLAIGRDLVKRAPFMLELRNTPYEAQKQMLFYIVDRLPLFRSGKLDAGGNGGYLAEVAQQRYGARIEAVMLNEPWYREHMPRWKAAFEDGQIVLPRDREVLDDHRLVKLIRGVGRVPDERTGEAGKRRHGDSAIASALAIAASAAEPEVYDYESVPAADSKPFEANAWRDRPDENEDDRDTGGGAVFPAMGRRVYP